MGKISVHNYNYPPYEKDSETSMEAAISIEPHVGNLQRAVLDVLDTPRTCDEVEELLDMKHQTASARIRELAQMGLIESVGKAKTRSGRNAVLWKVVKKEVQPELGFDIPPPKTRIWD